MPSSSKKSSKKEEIVASPSLSLLKKKKQGRRRASVTPSKNTSTKKRKYAEQQNRASATSSESSKKRQKTSSTESKKASRFASLDQQLMSSDQFFQKELKNQQQFDSLQEEELVDVDEEMRKLGVIEGRRQKDSSSSESSSEDESDSSSEAEEKAPVVVSKKQRVRSSSHAMEIASSSSDEGEDSDSSSSEDEPAVETKKSQKKKREFGVDIDKDVYRMKISALTHQGKSADDEDDSDAMESDDEFAAGGALLGDESDEEDDENDPLRQMIEASRQIDQEQALQEEEAEEELKHMVLQQPDSTLMQDVDQQREQQPEDPGIFAAEDITQIFSRIAENLRVLTNFKQFKEEGYTRQDYLELLKEDLCKYYGYLPDLIDKFSSMFSAAELVELLEANEAPRPVVLRTNPLKSRRREVAEALIRRGVNLDPLSRWSNVGLKVHDTQVPVGATPEYLAGWYMIQGASSFLPVIALNPGPNEVVVDMASAPGGKTTYMSALMKNTGVIYANDPEKKRTKGLTANIYRLGVRNAIVCNYDGRELPTVVHPKADKVLLDAPCSGTGIIARDPSVKTTRDNEDIAKMSKLQKELLLAAIDTCKDPQKTDKPVYIVYSTCSITPEENEEVVSYALKKRFVKVVETGLPKKMGKPGFKKVYNKRFDPSVALTRRIYPHAHNMDGFYVCKLQKVADGPRDPMEKEVKEMKHQKLIQEKQAKKKENIALQKEREVHNRKLLQTAKQKFGGNVEAAKQWMHERKTRLLSDPDYKNLKPKKNKKKRMGR